MARIKAMVRRFPPIERRNTTKNETIQNKRDSTATKNSRYLKKWTNNKNNKSKKKV